MTAIYTLVEGTFDRGDANCLAVLTKQVSAWLRPKVPRNDLDDRVQDALEKLMSFWQKEGRERLRAQSDDEARAYLFRVAQNAAISAWRKEQKSAKPAMDGYVDTTPTQTVDGHESSSEQLGEDLRRALSSLDKAVVERYPALTAVFAQVQQLASDPSICNDDLLGEVSGDRPTLRLTLQQHHCRWRKKMREYASKWLESGKFDESEYRLVLAFIERSRQRRKSR
ncbi:MAG: sigma factor [Deltaproteobacteria bacterium]|nr:sigma factor [Deltaproteobacteria bacterium]